MKRAIPFGCANLIWLCNCLPESGKHAFVFAVLLPEGNRFSCAFLTKKKQGLPEDVPGTLIIIANRQTLFCPGSRQGNLPAKGVLSMQVLHYTCESLFLFVVCWLFFHRSRYLPKGVRHARLVLDSCHVLHQGVLVDLHCDCGALQATATVTVTSIPLSVTVIGCHTGGSSSSLWTLHETATVTVTSTPQALRHHLQ